MASAGYEAPPTSMPNRDTPISKPASWGMPLGNNFCWMRRATLNSAAVRASSASACLRAVMSQYRHCRPMISPGIDQRGLEQLDIGPLAVGVLMLFDGFQDFPRLHDAAIVVDVFLRQLLRIEVAVSFADDVLPGPLQGGTQRLIAEDEPP